MKGLFFSALSSGMTGWMINRDDRCSFSTGFIKWQANGRWQPSLQFSRFCAHYLAKFSYRTARYGTDTRSLEFISIYHPRLTARPNLAWTFCIWLERFHINHCTKDYFYLLWLFGSRKQTQTKGPFFNLPPESTWIRALVEEDGYNRVEPSPVHSHFWPLELPIKAEKRDKEASADHTGNQVGPKLSPATPPWPSERLALLSLSTA